MVVKDTTFSDYIDEKVNSSWFIYYYSHSNSSEVSYT
ncbi:hypothetical protein PMIT1312_02060 [Prochlorococcus marinus str. MIT 1312]|nr:hypothetical protein PMIT1312_02060 [Prochlorococcus marinus str. MIT 1312]